MDERIWLHVEAGPDGLLVVKDQRGLQLAGVRLIEATRRFNDVCQLRLEVVAGIDGPISGTKRGSE